MPFLLDDSRTIWHKHSKISVFIVQKGFKKFYVQNIVSIVLKQFYTPV